jgi:hypothetical protein
MTRQEYSEVAEWRRGGVACCHGPSYNSMLSSHTYLTIAHILVSCLTNAHTTLTQLLSLPESSCHDTPQKTN